MKRLYSSEFPDRRLHELVFQFELPAEFPRDSAGHLYAIAESLAQEFGEQVEDVIKMEDYACHVLVEPISSTEHRKKDE